MRLVLTLAIVVKKGMIKFQNTYSKLPKHFFSEEKPDILNKTKLIAFNESFAKEVLGLNIGEQSNEDILNLFSGQNLPSDITPIALAYAGHQFGHFVPQLGDGRAVLLGEIKTAKGSRYDIQLKGSGRTFYSRGGDGKSPIGPVIREYIVSEAMHHLGIPTTRALAAVSTGETVYRDSPLPGGIFTRVASSHIRIGTFEFFASRNDVAGLRTLADYTIERHFPEVKDVKDKYLKFLECVAQRQSSLVANWMSVGFIHGVMNTDNMSISGETIDFGPCAFLDDFSFDKVFSSIDRHGRYSYSNQLEIAKWNLCRLAECLIPLIDSDEKKAISAVESEMEDYFKFYQKNWLHKMNLKLGLFGDHEGDEEIINTWLMYLKEQKLDFTLSFQKLAEDEYRFEETTTYQKFKSLWLKRLSNQDEDLQTSKTQMRKVNPIFIARNHNVEKAIVAAVDEDYSIFNEMNELLKNPYKDQEDFSSFKLSPTSEEVVCATFCGT
jgi:uncharacterized protein YdiU (UPF0061 family)